MGQIASCLFHDTREAKTTTTTTSNVAYDMEKHKHILSWDKRSLIINGFPTPILSGEFHYWRVPDHTQWRNILLTYKEAGLNCIRIYFNWAFHSPNESTYLFDGNKDVNFLLHICKELNLLVLAAPGPYICAGFKN